VTASRTTARTSEVKRIFDMAISLVSGSRNVGNRRGKLPDKLLAKQLFWGAYSVYHDSAISIQSG
jgi:hypothetical protein